MKARTVTCTVAAMLAFAGNSVLCRLALGRGAIDAASFTSVRLLSGAIALLVLRLFANRPERVLPQPWRPALILIVYAIPFSYAYISLSAGAGALILFGTVQVTMIASAIAAGDRPHPWQWIGLASAIAGLVYLVMPGLSAPPAAGAALMAVAGVCWALYTLEGRTATDPIQSTAANFLRCAPFALLLLAITLRSSHLTMTGVALAAVSGALTSGVGYVVWYLALRGLSALRAAAVQLAVPLIAAFAGVVFLGERFTIRLGLASVLVLGGIALGLIGRERRIAGTRVS